MEPRTATGIATGTELDVGLIERARRGDAPAFEQLLAPRLDRLFRTAWAIVGREADARDATQEACLNAWRKLPTLRQPERFDAWLDRILINSCRMALRHRGRVREVALPDGVEDPPAPPDEVARYDETELIARAFDRLSAADRSILVLHHLQHEPIARIAISLGIPSGTVKWRLHGARKALATALEGERR